MPSGKALVCGAAQAGSAGEGQVHQPVLTVTSCCSPTSVAAPSTADVVSEGRLLLIVANKLDALAPAQRQQALALIRQTVEDSLPDVR